MASRTFASLAGGARSTLDVPVAALAGLAVAVLAFSMPAGLLGDLVGATGLPSIVAAAEPPLGFKARFGLGAGGAVAVFAVTFLLLRWLERNGRRRPPAEEQEVLELEIEAPRLRRRDVHPDAPARAPLLAAHELGEPDLESNDYLADARSAWPTPGAHPEPAPAAPPSPIWGAPAQTVEACEPMPPVAEPATADPEVDNAAAYALSQRHWSDPDAILPERMPAPAEIAPMDEIPAMPAPVEMARDEVSTTPDLPAEAVFEAPCSIARETRPVAEAPNPWSPEQVAEADVRAEIAPAPVVAPQPGSLSELMERLERGLARRRTAPEPETELETEAGTAPANDGPPADDRLQNAINSLQRFASRQD